MGKMSPMEMVESQAEVIARTKHKERTSLTRRNGKYYTVVRSHLDWT